MLLVHFFENSGYLSLMIRENGFPDVPRLQAMLHSLDEFFLSVLRRLMLLRGTSTKTPHGSQKWITGPGLYLRELAK